MKQESTAHLYSAKASRSRRLAIRHAVKRLGFSKKPELSELRQKPKIEVRQDDRTLAIIVDVLGLVEVRVVLEEGPPSILSIEGKQQFDDVDNCHNVRIAARGSSKFNATLVLPPDIDQRTVDACFEGSLLMLVGEKRPREHHFNVGVIGCIAS